MGFNLELVGEATLYRISVCTKFSLLVWFYLFISHYVFFSSVLYFLSLIMSFSPYIYADCVEGITSWHIYIIEMFCHSRAAPKVMPLETLKEITNNFSIDRELGSGTFGIVYKVSMHSFVLSYNLLAAIKYCVLLTKCSLQSPFSSASIQ
jgi:hypothetical protein